MPERYRLKGRFFCCLISVVLAIAATMKADDGPAKTTIQDVLYRADGTPASGTLLISWPAFTTSDQKPVTAGSMSLRVGTTGQVTVALAPNAGAMPSGTYYRILTKLDDGTSNTEYWVVPSVDQSPVTIGAVRVEIMPLNSTTADYVHKAGDSMSGQLAIAAPIIATAMSAGTVTATGEISAQEVVTALLPRVDVRAYGAKGDGTSNDTSAIKAAVAYSLAHPQANGYSPVYFSAGTYLIDGEIRIPSVVPVVGDGPTSAVLKQTHPTANLLTVYSQGVVCPFSSCPSSISGLTLEGNGHLTTGTLLELDNTQNFVIENVYQFNHGGRGLVVNDASERLASYNLTSERVRWPIVLSGDNNESYFKNAIVIWPGSDEGGYCWNINCGMNGATPGTLPTSGSVRPDPHAAIYIHNAQNTMFEGGSIKPGPYLSGVKTGFYTENVELRHIYWEGYGTNCCGLKPDGVHDWPRINSAVINGGVLEKTTTAQAVTGPQTVIPITNASWMPDWYGTPTDTNCVYANGGHHYYVIYPPDFVYPGQSGSTSSSLLGNGIKRGMFEVVGSCGFSSDGLHTAGRGQGGSTDGVNVVGNGSGTSANQIAWPAGAIVSDYPGKDNTPLKLADDQINLFTWNLAPPYSAGCDAEHGAPCGNILAGYAPDLFVPLPGAGGLTWIPSKQIEIAGTTRMTPDTSTDSNGNVMDPWSGSVQVLNNASVTVTGMQGESTGLQSAMAPRSQGLSSGNLVNGAQSVCYSNGNCANMTTDDLAHDAHSSSGSNYSTHELEYTVPQASAYYVPGGNYTTRAVQFMNGWALLDTPSGGTQPTNMLEFRGGPGQTGGLYYSQYVGGAWKNPFFVEGNGDGTVTTNHWGDFWLREQCRATVSANCSSHSLFNSYHFWNGTGDAGGAVAWAANPGSGANPNLNYDLTNAFGPGVFSAIFKVRMPSLTVGSTDQTGAHLAENFSVDSTGKVTAPQYCIGANCINSWPSVPTAPPVNAATAGQIAYYAGAGSTVSGDGNLTADASGNVTANSVATKLLPVIDIRSYGAAGDGVTDNCTPITNAFTACSNATLYVPHATFLTSCGFIIPASCDVKVDGTLRASARMNYLLGTGSGVAYGFWDRNSLSGTGTLDGNGKANSVLWLKQYRQSEISGVNISGIAANGVGIHLGSSDSIGGYAAQIHDIQWGQHSNAVGSGSVCLQQESVVTDLKFYDSDPHGCQTGVVDYSSGNRYLNLHAWDNAMTVCYDDYGNGNFWTASQCDSPQQYGWHVHGFGTHLVSDRAFCNNTSCVNNTATAFDFDQADPNVTMVDNYITSADASHLWAADSNANTSNFVADTVMGTGYGGMYPVTRNLGNVAMVPQITSLVRSQLRGGYYLTNTVVPPGATPVFDLTQSTLQRLTLSANVTSSTVTGTVYCESGTCSNRQLTTFAICQPASGGPYTFTWPANTVGGGTIGTTPGTCNYQTFEWDGVTLRAITPMMVNDGGSVQLPVITKSMVDSTVRTTAGGSTITTADTVSGMPSGCTQYPCRVAHFSLTGQTASIGTTALFTPAQTGTYRFSAYVFTTAAGSAGTATVSVNYQNGSGAQTWASSSASLTSLNGANQIAHVFHATANQPINYLTTVSGAAGSPQYAVDVVLEQLQ